MRNIHFRKNVIIGTVCQNTKLTDKIPSVVHGSYTISSTRIRDLGITPYRVKGDFAIVYEPDLPNLNGGPNIVEGTYQITDTGIDNLVGLAWWIDSDLVVQYNNLSSLQGAPRFIKGDFICRHNKLTKFEGGPAKVSGKFDCSYNNIESFNNGPVQVGSFICKGNPIKSLVGLPKIVDTNFVFTNNDLKVTESDIRDVCDVRGHIFL